MNEELFTKLVTTPGISGREARIRSVVLEEIEAVVDEVKVDKLGNVLGTRAGESPRVMLSAHMDSIGFLVKHIDDNGFIRISPVGGFDPRTLVDQRVLVCGRKDCVGLLSPAGKPVHLLADEDKNKAPKIEEMFVDVMMPRDEVRENVSVGDQVVLFRHPILTDSAVTAPYLDDRLGVYILIEALRKASSVAAEIHAVVSVQEEVGLRGARTSAYASDPDMGIALDITLATDTPGTDPTERVSAAGEGVAIAVMDSASISDPRLVEAFKGIAEKHGIEHQLEIMPRGGTDAGTIQMARSGVPVITISTPVRYVHTSNEMALTRDIDANVELLASFLESAHQIDLTW